MKPLTEWAEFGRELYARDPVRFEEFIAEARALFAPRLPQLEQPPLRLVAGGRR